MNSNVEIRLREGDREIQLAGPPDVVSTYLEKYWPPRPTAAGGPQVSVDRAPELVPDNGDSTTSSVDAVSIANAIKESDRSEELEERVLDSRRQVERVILPLYAAAVLLGRREGLTPGEISQVLTELGTSIAANNVAKVLRGAAKSFVLANGKNGRGRKYALNRRGVKHLEEYLGELNN